MNQIMTAKEFRKQKKPSKYRNKKIRMDYQGEVLSFDSRKEFARWQLLSALSKSGDIQELKRQVTFKLEVNGSLICKYIADFVYKASGELIVEDVKSEPTRKLAPYRMKKKMMKAIHGIEIQEV